jgi:hypothetical protein
MTSLRVLLGLFPKTADIEEKRAALELEYSELLAFLKSKELTEYSELDKVVNSPEFEQRKKGIQSQKYNDTEEYRKEKQYLKLTRDPEIRNYYKIKSSQQLKDLQEFEASEELKKYLKLEKYLDSDDFKSVKKYMALSPKQKFEQTELHANLQQYEQQRKSSWIKNYYKVVKHAAFSDYNNLIGSDRLETFVNLEKFVKSGKVDQAKRNLSKREFSQSEESKKLSEYKQLKKSKEIRNYIKITSLPYFNDFNRLDNSPEIEAYEELQKHILSAEFRQERNKVETAKFRDTEEYRKEQEYNGLKKSGKFIDNFKFKSSKNYQLYLKLDGSKKIEEYEELKSFIESDNFLKVKEYMLLSAKKKLEQSEEHQQELRYKELHSSEKIQWYLKVRDSDKFDAIKNWKVTFEENFDADKLDRKKWITRYFWGETILHDSYSLASEKQFYTDGKNLEINNSILKIITKKEKAEGKAWNPKIGFFPREFEYTSGLINTGSSFRQKYGIFEAKIRFGIKNPVNHAFWMLSDQILPHIDIAKIQKKLVMSNIWGNIAESNGIKKNVSKLGSSRFSKDFFIYTLEWAPDRLTWKVNGLTIATVTEGVPQQPMYLLLSSALYKDVNGTVLPASMEVDWVKCYTAAK